jgi:hypothetical protein
MAKLTWPKILVAFIVLGLVLVALGFVLRSATTSKEHRVSAHVESVAYENALTSCETRGNEQRRFLYTLAEGQSHAKRSVVANQAKLVMREMTSAPHALPDGEVECSEVIEKP